MMVEKPKYDHMLSRAWHWLPSYALDTLQYTRGGIGTPTRVARLRVPNILHPIVLHGLAFTPRAQALDKIASKAIAQAAFEKLKGRIFRNIVFDVLSLIAISRITGAVRRNTLDSNINGDNWCPVGPTSCITAEDYIRVMVLRSFVIIVVVWIRNTLGEISLYYGYR